MAKSITEVTANNTFQVWLDKTNEIVDLINSDIFTASALGDTTIGDATLVGTLSANTFITNNLLRVDTVSPKVGSTAVSVTAPVNITTNQVVLERLTSVTGPRIAFTDGAAEWQAGFENVSNKNFVITSGGGSVFRMSTAGAVEVSGSVSATSFIGNASTATRFANAVNINGVAFNGSLPITITSNTTNTLTRGSYLTGSNFDGSAATTWAVDATTTNTASKVVARDASGNFSAGTITANLIGIITGTAAAGGAVNLVTGTMADNDQFRILVGGAADAGYAEIATADDGTEPIYVSQYQGNFATLTRRATILDASGNTSFPGAVSSVGITNTSTMYTSGKLTVELNTATPNYSTGHVELRSTNASSVSIGFHRAGFTACQLRHDADGLILSGTGQGVSANFTATGNITAFSDARLKKNVRTIDDAVNKVSQMRGVYFSKDDKESVGVIAQEIEKVLPEVVYNDYEYKSVAYGNIVGVLIEAIKELNIKLNELSAEIGELKKVAK
jgi:hypothetical protein